MASLYKVICVQKQVKNSEIDDRMVSEITVLQCTVLQYTMVCDKLFLHPLI